MLNIGSTNYFDLEGSSLLQLSIFKKIPGSSYFTASYGSKVTSLRVQGAVGSQAPHSFFQSCLHKPLMADFSHLQQTSLYPETAMQ